MNPFSNSRGDAAAVSPRGEAPDENTVVDKMVAHPDAVAQKGSGREQAGGVHRQDPDALFLPPILEYSGTPAFHSPYSVIRFVAATPSRSPSVESQTFPRRSRRSWHRESIVPQDSL